MSQGNDHSKAGGNYERPNNQYRCGRGASWRTPCPQGPLGGKCGGTAECQAVLKNGRHECRRPASSGGPCPGGPKPDGACSQTHPPCVPRLTLRARRGRLVWQLSALLLLLLAAGFHFGRGAKSIPFSADPGPLSAKHAHFTEAQGCATCHAAHNADLGGLLKATFTPADMNAQCAACHKFGGPADRPHNETSTPYVAAHSTDCRQCHVEHRGFSANITVITDAQCHTCHKVKFERVDRGHPPFAANFPHSERDGIKFNHTKHLLDYFKQPQQAANAPTTCAECHAATPHERVIRTAGFDAACARCHGAQIPQNDLVLLRLPELPADPGKLTTDDATTFMAWLFQRPGASNYGVALQQLVEAAAKDGAGALARTLEAQGGTNTGVALLAGLSPELLQRPAQLWLKREKFEPSQVKAQSGWYWFEDLYPELHYKPAGHGDAVARAWLEFALTAAARATNADDAKRAVAFRDEIAQPRTGVGRCLKCHAVNPPANAETRPAGSTPGTPLQPQMPHMAWQYRGTQLPAHTTFSHGAHVGLTRCEACHALNPQADYERQFQELTRAVAVSNFKAIALSDCTSCHAETKVRHDCRLCHEFHRGPTVNQVALRSK